MKSNSNTVLSFAKNKTVLIFIVASALALLFWIFYNPVGHFVLSNPGLDNRPDKKATENENVVIGEFFTKYKEHTSELKGKWTNFRGQEHDNISKEKIPLIEAFGDVKSRIKWQVMLGEGHSAPVVYNGKVYLLDYIEAKKRDALKCFSLETGEMLWMRSYDVHIKRNHGMSRTVPAVNDSFLVTLGPMGHAMCMNRETGDLLWTIDLVKEYRTEIPFWYTGQCPVIKDNIAVFAPAGSVLMIGVDCRTGNVVWQTPNPMQWKMSHSSIMPMQLDGQNTWIYAAVGGMCAVNADGDKAGAIVWQETDYSPAVVAPSPLVLPDNRVLISAGYGAGSALIKLTKSSGGMYDVNILQQYKPTAGLASEQQTPILINDKVYGILPKDAGSSRNQFVCTTADDFTNYLWASGKEERFGLGPYLYADEKFFILDDDGTMTIARVSDKGFTVLDQQRIIEGHDAWGPLVITDGYLLMRDSKNMLCLDIRK